MSEEADDEGWLELVGVEGRESGECWPAEARSGLTAAETAALVLSLSASRRDIFVVILLCAAEYVGRIYQIQGVKSSCFARSTAFAACEGSLRRPRTKSLVPPPLPGNS